MHRLEYRKEVRRSHSFPVSIFLPLVLLVLDTGIIWALHKLAVMPYNPPNDMSTLLDEREEAVVSRLIAFFGVIWVGMLWWCFVELRPSPEEGN
jgi:hypothetical protein